MKQNRIWLLSFADLAFLLLIGFTQVAGKHSPVGGISLPAVEKSTAEPLSESAAPWRLFVHQHPERPFELTRNENPGEGELLSTVELYLRLDDIKALDPPWVIPLEKSLAWDLLTAHSSVVAVWTDADGVAVTLESLRNILESERTHVTAP